MASQDQSISLLKKNGLRRTPVRLGVIDLLSKTDRPMSVPQIVGKLRGVDTVTVYRTLNTFVRKGLVHRVRGEDRSWRYATSSADAPKEHRHPHFVCDQCGKVECLQDSVIPAGFVGALGVARGYAVTYPEVVLHGTCPRCGP